MRLTGLRKKVGFVLAAGTVLCAPTAFARDISYHVARGDTLSALARQHFKPGHGWRDLQRYNRISRPRRLQVNRVLRIPSQWLRIVPQTARLSAYHGDVSVRVGQARRKVVRDMELAQSTFITTGAASFASLNFPDGSTLSIRPNSTVRLTQLGMASLTGGLVRLFDVLAGTARFKVSPEQERDDDLRVRTPLVVASVRGTEFRTVTLLDQGISRVEVVEGTVAVESTDTDREEIVERAHGVVARRPDVRTQDHRGEGLSVIQPLPAAPNLIDGGRIQDEEMTQFAVRPQDDARQWHLTLGRDAGFIDTFDELYTTTGQASFAGVPDGDLYVRATAITADGFEGVARDYAFRRFRYSFKAEVAREMLANVPVYRFRWQHPPQPDSRFRFVLRRQGGEAPALVDELALHDTQISIPDLGEGVYLWKVGRWVYQDGNAILKWDDEHELVIER